MTNCNFCHKKGLLIYPVRYAVASPYGADGVPGLSGNFRIEDAPQAAGAAKYTLRALRPGYLYTYDERRQRLKAYVVHLSRSGKSKTAESALEQALIARYGSLGRVTAPFLLRSDNGLV
ncbi:toxin VasX, partial [Herbaspirillum sp.]|uniref:toxin VasX n=2 Tax=Herbaspirillum sp. TaxID=1890675 RepID=UPI0031D3F726